MIRYRCRHCGSDDVQGTLPVWFTANTVEHVEVDAEADWDSGWCEACETGGDFLDVAERVEP